MNVDNISTACLASFDRPQCCDGKCYDLDSDADHCGDCATACPDPDDECCHGQCIDPKTDREHCGGCDRSCLSADSVCCNGQCVSPEVAEQMGPIECCPTGRRCVDRGVCCPKGSRCTGSGFDARCTCAPGWDECRAAGGELVCCAPGQKCCGDGVCIPDNEFCCPPGQRWLEPCGCCPEGSTCRNGRCVPPDCPGVTTPCEVVDENGELVARVCCSYTEICLNDGAAPVCMPRCGSSYCTDGEVCCEARGECLPPGYPCCQPDESPYQFACKSGCCPPNTHVCGCCEGTCKQPDEVCECA